MSDWNFSGAFWGTPANWTGSVPDGVGVTATIDASALSGPGTQLVVFEDNAAYLVGHLTLNTSTRAIALQGGTSTISAELNFFAGTGEPAVIEADSNGTSNLLFINGDNGLHLSFYDYTQIITHNSTTTLAISAPISGNGQIVKLGTGTLVLNGENSFFGGLEIASGDVKIADDVNLGFGRVTLHGGSLIVTGSTTINNDLLVDSVTSSGHFAVAPGQTATLSSGMVTLGVFSTLAFGSAGNTGTIALAAGASHVSGSGDFELNFGTITFANAANAANFFHFSGNGQTNLAANATLDTAGFATRLSNFYFDGGTLTSSTGALNVRFELNSDFTGRIGTVIGTAGADRLLFLGSQYQDRSGLAFANWTSGTDKIILLGTDQDDILKGTGMADTLLGGGGADTLNGGLGNDLINGQAGIDIASGGDGNDTYFIDNSADVVTESLNQGTDRVLAKADFVLSDNVEQLVLQGTARSGTGNGLNNTILGSNGNDTLLSGLDGSDTIDGRLGSDILLGGNGQDFLTGGAGKDTMTGGADRDRFVFHDGDMKTTHALADIITDFDQGLDERIGLTGVDANEALGGVQTFKFIGTSAFSGTAGELRFVQEAGNTFIEGNTDTDLVADFVIRLDGLYTLDVTDFFGVTL